MNKSELVKTIASQTLLSQKQVNIVLNALIDIVTTEVTKGEKVTFVGFGTFEVSNRKEREGRNPKTGEAITIPAARVPAFHAGKTFKEKVAK